ncbi:MAG: ABC transporter permease [Spirochaetaceae bacterium]|nr:ABC transporter permease [Spirochaetaceae bacterium]
MVEYIARRGLFTLLLLALVSVVSFVIIQLPPGDYLSTYIMALQEQGEDVSEAQIETLRAHYGLGLPIYVQYFKWMWGVLRGNFGVSFEWNVPVAALIGERLALTLTIAVATLVFTYLLAIPIGIYSATHQYSVGDYTFTTVGFIGLATPNFLLALILMFLFFKYLGLSVGGLFSPEYLGEPWSAGKVLDLIRHLPIPIIVVGTAGTAAVIRIMRGSLLDELGRQYVITARAKGLKEGSLLFKYPVRVAVNPIVSTVGWALPSTISGATITAIVLSLPTAGPLLLRSLRSQDMYLAASIVMMLSAMTILGTFVSDLLLAWVDPRIRFERSRTS